MVTREVLQDWVMEALKARGGSASVLEVCKHIWSHHEQELRGSERLLYTWQYDVHWAAQQLRNTGKLKPAHGKRSKPWEIA